ncbi:MAG: Gfo/Idh/MocA family oxidoreductase [Pirellulales bacterium]|nr:Gfo/Idh/MocA family oxidoreductase [Pirellulales bacterium]
MKTLKFGLIGLGFWPREAYVPILRELDTAEVVAVSAASEATRQFACEQFGESLKTYPDYHDLLADDAVEAVMLALPHALYPQALPAALASGKHVFCEPPLSHIPAEIANMLALMDASTKVVQLDLELRYLPVVEAVKNLLDSGSVGRPLMSKVRLACDWRRGVIEKQNENENEGFFPWVAAWYLDLLDCVFSQPPARASVTGDYAAAAHMMDHGFATLEFDGGGIGQFEFFLLGSKEVSITLDILAEGGEIQADIPSGKWQWRKTNEPFQQEHNPASLPAHGFEGMRECITSFVDAALNNTPVLADVDVARRIHAGIVACMLSERAGHTVEVGRFLET